MCKLPHLFTLEDAYEDYKKKLEKFAHEYDARCQAAFVEWEEEWKAWIANHPQVISQTDKIVINLDSD